MQRSSEIDATSRPHLLRPAFNSQPPLKSSENACWNPRICGEVNFLYFRPYASRANENWVYFENGRGALRGPMGGARVDNVGHG